jgi:hypothetical protein
MFTNEVCTAAVGRLNRAEQGALQQEAVRRACSINEAMLQVALENLQQQLYALPMAGRRLRLVKG